MYTDSYPLGFSIETMIADKVAVFLSQKIYRRAKDLYDLYILSYAKDYHMRNLLSDIQHKGNKNEAYHIADNDQLEHAYNKLEGIIKKPDFETVMARVVLFVYPIGEALKAEEPDLFLVWFTERGEWA
ncbi:hypothetical protein [Paenibacillus medicaginis]|uniref:Uncharacterized protein n=1 Tax=Paenibacillus medicaginis TaxID=1470560 RepID=A0ABV5C430_9BACL